MNVRKKVLIGVLGWGRGHASRCDAIATALIEHGFDVKMISDFQGYDYLKTRYDATQLIKCQMFKPTVYRGRNLMALNVLRGFRHKYVLVPKESQHLESALGDWQPDIVLCDTELISCCYAQRKKIPFINISSIYFMQRCHLPFRLSLTERLYIKFVFFLLENEFCTKNREIFPTFFVKIPKIGVFCLVMRCFWSKLM